jgi:hypothetical protein
MSNISVNTITDASGGSTASINGLTPQASNMQPYNILINGSLDVWQRGTSSTATGWGYYTADRWKTNLRDGAGTASQYVLNGELNPFVYAHKLAITSAATTSPVMQQITEDSRRYKGQTVTLSFYAKASKSITLTTVYDLVWANSSNASASTGHSLTTSWQRFTVTTTLPDPSGTYNSTYDHLYTKFSYPTSDTYDVYITGVQLEVGSSASSFAHENYGDTLQKCLRYFQIWKDDGNTLGAGVWYASNQVLAAVPLQQVMRASPTVTVSAANWATVYGVGTSHESNDLSSSVDKSRINSLRLNINMATTTTAGQGAMVMLRDDNQWLKADAEL